MLHRFRIESEKLSLIKKAESDQENAVEKTIPIPMMLLPSDKWHITVQGHESSIELTSIVKEVCITMTDK